MISGQFGGGSRIRLGLLGLLVLPTFVLLVPACGGDDDNGGTAPPNIWRAPAGMEGNWHFTMEMYEHSSQELIEEQDFESPICSGDAAVVDIGQGVDCDIDPTDEGFHMVCQQVDAAPIADCNIVTDIDIDFDCTDDTMAGTGTATTRYEGAGCGELDGVDFLVLDIVFSGEKIGPAPEGECGGKSLCESLQDALTTPLRAP